MLSWLKHFIGGSAAAPAPALGNPVPLDFRVEEAEPLRGSPSGTQAWVARLGNGANEARFRFQLAPSTSQVSEHFTFDAGAFWREPSNQSILPLLCNAFATPMPELGMRLNKLPVRVVSFEAEPDGWFRGRLILQESKADIDVRFNLATGNGQLILGDPARRAEVIAELAQVL